MNKIIILAIVVVAVGAGYALVPRNVLKDYFQNGDIPNQEAVVGNMDSAAANVPEAANKKNEIRVLNTAQTTFKMDKEESMKFSWGPVTTKNTDKITYRLKVWQLMQGQNGTQAMRSNQPIVTKDVDNVTEATVGGIYTGPCRPPYLCEFVWAVETLKTDSVSKTDAVINTGTKIESKAVESNTTGAVR